MASCPPTPDAAAHRACERGPDMLRQDYFRFGITVALTALFSLLRTTEYSTVVKPLPVIWWLLIALGSPRRPGGAWVLLSLSAAILGDILLDLGEDWLRVGTLPFLGSTLILAIAFHLSAHPQDFLRRWQAEAWLLAPVGGAAWLLFRYLSPHLGESRLAGGVLLTLSVLLLWRAGSAYALTKPSLGERLQRRLGLLGASGIVANYVLYAVDLSVQPIPRDLVIQVYYWGQAFATWSFLSREPVAPLGRGSPDAP